MRCGGRMRRASTTCPGPRPPSERTSSAFTASPIPLAAPAEALTNYGGRILLLRRARPERLPERPGPASRALPADPQPGPGQDDRDDHGLQLGPGQPLPDPALGGGGRLRGSGSVPMPPERAVQHRLDRRDHRSGGPRRALLLGSGAGVRRLDVALAHGARGAAHALPMGHFPPVGVRGVRLDLGRAELVQPAPSVEGAHALQQRLRGEVPAPSALMRAGGHLYQGPVPHSASWKMTPRLTRSPAVTRLTPWRTVTR